MFKFLLVLFGAACSQLVACHEFNDEIELGSDSDKLYEIKMSVLDIDNNEDEHPLPIWFQIIGFDNIQTEWFSLTKIETPNTIYDISRFLKNIDSEVQTLKIVKLDSNKIEIDNIFIDHLNYDFSFPQTIGINNNNENKDSCDILTIDFVSHSHYHTYYNNNCPKEILNLKYELGYVSSTFLNEQYEDSNFEHNSSLPAPLHSTLLKQSVLPSVDEIMKSNNILLRNPVSMPAPRSSTILKIDDKPILSLNKDHPQSMNAPKNSKLFEINE